MYLYIYIYIYIYTYSICIPIIHRTIMGYIRNSDCFLLRTDCFFTAEAGCQATPSVLPEVSEQMGRSLEGNSQAWVLSSLSSWEAAWLGDWKYSWGDLEKASTWSSTSTSLCGKKCGSFRAIWFNKGTVPTGWRICRTLRRFQIYQNTLDIPTQFCGFHRCS